MTGPAAETEYPRVAEAMTIVADWLKRCRDRLGLNDDLAQCDPAEAQQIAADLGVPLEELHTIIRHGPDGAAQLRQMLAALGMEPDWIVRRHPGVMQDLQRLCASCHEKALCAHEMSLGHAADRYRDFCPNAMTLDALKAEKSGALPETAAPAR